MSLLNATRYMRCRLLPGDLAGHGIGRNDLSRAANRTVLNYCQMLLGTEVTPSLIVARHTFGESARFHPHLHTIVTGGGWDTDHKWHAVFGWDRPVLRELFEIEVFRFLRERELLSVERMQLIRSWRHSGFDVYVGGPIGPDNRELLEHIARYLLRAPLSLERMRYNPQEGSVTIFPLSSEDNTPLVMEALEFISRLILHIPDPQERMVTYCGPYANASKHRRSPAQSPDTGAGSAPVPEPEETTPFERKLSVRWAQLIKQTWLEDPLLCPNCGQKMRIVAFITDPMVVDMILRHLKWKPGQPAPTNIRAPPMMAQVAAST